MPSRSGILRLGVTEYPFVHSNRVLAIGGIGVLLSTRPFDEEAVRVAVTSIRSYDIGLFGQFLSTRPFDEEGSLQVFSYRPFDIVEHISTPVTGVTAPTRPAYLPSGAAPTAMNTPSVAGAATVNVDAVADIQVGDLIFVDGEYRIVTAIAPNP